MYWRVSVNYFFIYYKPRRAQYFLQHRSHQILLKYFFSQPIQVLHEEEHFHFGNLKTMLFVFATR